MAKKQETNERSTPQRTQPTHATHMPSSPPTRRPTTDEDEDESVTLRDTSPQFGREEHSDRAGAQSERGGGEAERSGTRELMERGRQKAGEIGASASQTASEWASDAREAVSYAARRTQQNIAPMARSIRRNPWPAMLIGAGLTWLVVDGMRNDRGMSKRSNRRRDDDMQGNQSGQMGRTNRREGMAMASRVQNGLTRVVRQRPILAGAAAAGIGVVVSLVLPETERENELLGETRDALVDRAKDAARGTVEAAQGVADSVQQLTGKRP